MKKLTLSIVFFAILQISISQNLVPNFKPSDFELSGEAVKLGNNCFRLTRAINWASGSVWHNQVIDLHHSFEMEIDVKLGCEDIYGADGIMFVFYPYARRMGYKGEGIGFGGLVPSLGIELDTWENEHLSDPHYDHMAVLANGRITHWDNLAGPVPILPNKGNVEDCNKHKLKVSWESDSKHLSVSFDGNQRLSVKKDLVNQIFRGNSKVYWGFTAATGGFNNQHEICLEKLEVIPSETVFDPDLGKKLLNGDCVVLKNVQFESGKAILTGSAIAEVKRLKKFLQEHRGYKIFVYGHTDSYGSEVANKQISKLRANAVKQQLISFGISPKRIQTFGTGEKFPIAKNSTPEGRKTNRRIEICISKPRA